jgi:hypothetical protein
MSATEGTGFGGASAGIARTPRSDPLLAAEPREPATTGDLGRLGEVVLPADAAAAGAARIVIGHCLTGLVSRRIVGEAQLHGSELVSHSLLQDQADRGDVVLVRVYLGAGALRVEIENPGTRRGTVWFEMGRA